MFRPMLAQLAFRPNAQATKEDAPDDVSLEQTVIRRSATMCVMSALEALSLIAENLSEKAGQVYLFSKPVLGLICVA